jgi:hypothetical protein
MKRIDDQEENISTSGTVCCKRRPATSDPFKQTSRNSRKDHKETQKWHPKERRMRRSKRRGEVGEDGEGGHDGNQGDLGFLEQTSSLGRTDRDRIGAGPGFMPRGRVCTGNTSVLGDDGDLTMGEGPLLVATSLGRGMGRCWCCTPLAGPCRPPDLRRWLLQPAPR